MTKRHCDNCNKAISNEYMTVQYSSQKPFGYFSCELCMKCFKSIGKLNDFKKLAEGKEKE